MRQLVAALVHHFGVCNHETVFDCVIEKLGAGIGMRNGNLDRLDVELFGEINRVVDRVACFAGEAKDEVAVHHKPQLMAIFCELAGAFNGCALLDVLQNLLIS